MLKVFFHSVPKVSRNAPHPKSNCLSIELSVRFAKMETWFRFSFLLPYSRCLTGLFQRFVLLLCLYFPMYPNCYNLLTLAFNLKSKKSLTAFMWPQPVVSKLCIIPFNPQITQSGCLCSLSSFGPWWPHSLSTEISLIIKY